MAALLGSVLKDLAAAGESVGSSARELLAGEAHFFEETVTVRRWPPRAVIEVVGGATGVMPRRGSRHVPRSHSASLHARSELPGGMVGLAGVPPGQWLAG